jgi:hypothetical protein
MRRPPAQSIPNARLTEGTKIMQAPSCRHLRHWTRWKASYLVQGVQFLHSDSAHTGDPFWWGGPSPVPVEMRANGVVYQLRGR